MTQLNEMDLTLLFHLRSDAPAEIKCNPVMLFNHIDTEISFSNIHKYGAVNEMLT